MSIAEEIRRELLATEAGLAQLKAWQSHTGADSMAGYETLRGLIARAGQPFDAPGQALTAEQWALVRRCAPKDLPMKQCFMNSQLAVAQDFSGRLQYFEGFVFTGMFPLQHAWLVLDKTIVVDLTLVRDREKKRTNRLQTRIIGEIPSDYGYLGVPLTKQEIHEFQCSSGFYGCVLDNWKDRWPLLLKGKDRWPNHK